MTASCGRCGKRFDSKNPEDEDGDGKCPDCLEKSKRIAFEVDMMIAKKRRDNPLRDDPRAKVIKELLSAPEGTRVNARDLGIL